MTPAPSATAPFIALSLHRGIGLVIIAVTALVFALVIGAIIKVVTSDPTDFAVGTKPLWLILIALTGPIGATVWYLLDFRRRPRSGLSEQRVPLTDQIVRSARQSSRP